MLARRALHILASVKSYGNGGKGDGAAALGNDAGDLLEEESAGYLQAPPTSKSPSSPGEVKRGSGEKG